MNCSSSWRRWTTLVVVLLGSPYRSVTPFSSGLSPLLSVGSTPSVAFCVLATTPPCAASSAASSAHSYRRRCPSIRRSRSPPISHMANARTAEDFHAEAVKRSSSSNRGVGRGGASFGLQRDGEHMRRALELARQGVGRTRPNPAVGCVIVDKEGVVVGEGFHPRAGEPHAEVWAIRQAGERAKGGTAYVTLEPCNHYGRTPPCTNALLESGVSRVVAGMVDPDPRTAGSGLRRLSDAGLDVSVGVEGAACQALNSPFVHRILEKSCYGVLHCFLAASQSFELELEDMQHGVELAIPPDCHSYDEYDAIVVEGSSGVAKLEACMQLLPLTAFRVVVVCSGEGVERELGPVLQSSLWTDSPERTIIVVATLEGHGETNDTPGPVRASLKSRGITIVDFSLPSTLSNSTPAATPPEAEQPNPSRAPVAAEVEAAASDAVAGELYRRGLMSAAWDVSPGMSKRALQGGHIQRALVRRRSTVVDATVGGTIAKAEGDIDGERLETKKDGRRREEEEAVLQALRRIYGKDGMRVQISRDGVTRSGLEVETLIEVLFPVGPLPPTAPN